MEIHLVKKIYIPITKIKKNQGIKEIKKLFEKPKY